MLCLQMLFTFLFVLLHTLSPSVIYDFQKDAATTNWRVVDDGVMGGHVYFNE